MTPSTDGRTQGGGYAGPGMGGDGETVHVTVAGCRVCPVWRALGVEYLTPCLFSRIRSYRRLSMRIRGERECTACGTQWSYFETGSVTCPSCGDLRSIGVGDPQRHTDSPAEVDLSPVRELIDEVPVAELATEAKTVSQEYLRSRGFIHGGSLNPLDDTYLAVAELAHVADHIGRSFDPTEPEELYLLELIRGADRGNRPPVETVPSSLRAPRGLAYATAVRDYRRDLRDWMRGRGDPTYPPAVRRLADRLTGHVRRIRALSGDVDPREVERLVEATRDLGAALLDDDEAALASARNRLDRMG